MFCPGENSSGQVRAPDELSLISYRALGFVSMAVSVAGTRSL